MDLLRDENDSIDADRLNENLFIKADSRPIQLSNQFTFATVSLRKKNSYLFHCHESHVPRPWYNIQFLDKTM